MKSDDDDDTKPEPVLSSTPITTIPDIVTSTGIECNDSQSFLTQDSFLVSKMLKDGTRLDGNVIRRFPKKNCSLIQYNNRKLELMLWGTNLSNPVRSTVSSLMKKV